MKRNFLKVLVAVLSLGAIGIFAAGCSVGLEQPEWIKQAICDHVFDEKEVLREASCEEDGMTFKLCTDCGKTKIVTTPALGHTAVVTKEAVATTCTRAGKTEELTCSVCNEVVQEQVEFPALGHTMEGDTCTVCGFVDTSNYTEVAAEVGEKMVGNWYRIYRPNIASNTFMDFNGIKLSTQDGKQVYVMQTKFGNSLQDNAVVYNDSSSSFFAPSQITGMKIQIGDGYIDFLIEDNVIIKFFSEELIISKDTVIESIRSYGEGDKQGAFRLVPPCEQHVDEDTDAFCDNCSIFLLENATYEAVEVGDSAVGWFRIAIEEAKEKDFEVYCDVVDSDLAEEVYSCTKVKDVYGFDEGQTRLSHRILWCAEDSPCVGGYSNASERVSSFVEDGYLYIHIEESFTATITPEDGLSGKVNFKVGVFKSIMDGLERIVLKS